MAAEGKSVKAVLSAEDRGFTSTFKKALGTTDSLGSKLKSGLGFGVLMAVGTKAVNAVTRGVTGLIGEVNNSSAAWKTFDQNMKMSGKSTKEIKNVKKELQAFAQQTIYSASDMASTYTQLEAVGTKNTAKLVKGFGGLAAAAENPAQAMKTLSQQATQMAAKPQVAWQDFKLMIEQTPAGIAAVAKEMGMSTQQLVANVQDGKISTEDFFNAITKVGTNDGFTKLATTYKTAGQAMDGLKETLAGKLGPAFTVVSDIAVKAISKITDGLGSINGDAVAGKIQGLVTTLGSYWKVIKAGALEVGKAFGAAFSAVGSKLAELNGAFGSQDNIKGFSGVVDTVVGALTRLAGFIEDNAGAVAQLVSVLPKVYIAFKGFQIVSAIIGPLMTFGGAIKNIAAQPLAALAAKLFGTAAAEEAVGTASAATAGNVLAAGAAFLMLGGGVALAAVGLATIATAAINLAAAGPVAIGVMVGMVAALAGLAYGASVIGPALTAGAVGFIAFGAAIALVGVGALAAASALAIVAGVLPVVVQYGATGAVAILQLSGAMIAFGAGAAGAGAGAVVLGAGLAVLGATLVVVGAGALVAAAGMLALGAAVTVLGAGITLTAAGMVLLGTALPTVAAGALAAAAGMTALAAGTVALGATLAVASAALVAIGVAALAGTAGIAAFGLAMGASALGAGAMALALKLVNSSMKSIASGAKSANGSIKSMVSGVKVASSGLDALKNKAKSAISTITSAFKSASSSVKAAATSMMNGLNSAVTSGMSKAKAAATSGMTGFAAAVRTGGALAVASARSTASSVASALNSASGQARSAGRNIGAGLANGMASELGRVRSIAGQLASAAAAAIRAKAQIHSPSRVTKKLGAFFGEGFANGIDGMQRTVERASQALVAIPQLATDTGLKLDTGLALDADYSYSGSHTYVLQTQVDLDGRKLGTGTAKYTQEELNRRERLTSRRQGKRS